MSTFLFDRIRRELARQEVTLDLIPSENIAPPEVLAILGSPLTNKYAEGYPGERYYPGNALYDDIERLAQKNALDAFGLSAGAWAVNVQPYSGSPANQAVYEALLEPGDTVMGLKLSHGGHLTHGHSVSFSGKRYASHPYGVDLKTHRIDYRVLAALARTHRPKLIISGATAYPRAISFERIGAIAEKVGAYHLADISHISGLIIAKLHPSPFPYADAVMTTTHKLLRGPRGAVIFSRKSKTKDQKSKRLISEAIDRAVFPDLQGGPHNSVTAAIAWTFGEAAKPAYRAYARQVAKNARALARALRASGFNLVSGGTDTHLMLIDLRRGKLGGAAAEALLERAGMLANRNTVPGDAKPRTPSGIRIGTPSVTARGMREREMRRIGAFIYRTLRKRESPQRIKREVEKLALQFPLPYHHDR